MDFKIEDFISHKKSMLIAPAGYGKTYTIAECVAMGDGKSLILTHTNAGVAALKNRLKTKGVPSAKYHIETISGYAQNESLSICSPLCISNNYLCPVLYSQFEGHLGCFKVSFSSPTFAIQTSELQLLTTNLRIIFELTKS